MKQFLKNVLSVLLLRPQWYGTPRHPLLAAVLAACATVAGIVLVDGPGAMWLVACSYFMMIVILTYKILGIENLSPEDDRIAPALLRALFASMVAIWPLGLALAAGLPAELIAAFAVHGVMQLWLQVVLPSAFADVGAIPAQSAAPADRSFAGAGPAIGMFAGREIAAWLVDAQGRFWDFVGCTSDLASLCLREGQAVLRPGIIYEVRGGLRAFDH